MKDRRTPEVVSAALVRASSLLIFQCLNVCVCCCLKMSCQDLYPSDLAGNTREGEKLDVLWAITTGCQSMGQEWFDG